MHPLKQRSDSLGGSSVCFKGCRSLLSWRVSFYTRFLRKVSNALAITIRPRPIQGKADACSPVCGSRRLPDEEPETAPLVTDSFSCFPVGSEEAGVDGFGDAGFR